MKPHWSQPSHPEAIEVVTQPGSFASYSRAKKAFPPGALLARLSAPTLTIADRAYSSVQVGPSQDIELNCDFLYINHSCDPNLEFHVLGSEKLTDATDAISKSEHPIVIEIRVASRIDAQGHSIGLQAGESLSFFYPSTEWDMNQPFDCHCKTPRCKGTIRGAKHLAREEMKGYFFNRHILKLKDEQELERNDSGRMGANVQTGSTSVSVSQ